MKIYLVDGTYELFRSHFGAPPRKAPDGCEVGATLGLLRSLLMLLTTPGITHVACAFDHVIESFRNDQYPGYKTGAGVDPNLIAQFPLAEEAVSALGLVVWSMVEFEADDALSSATARFKDEAGVEQIVICSPDKDLAQLVSGSRIVGWDRRRALLIDEAGVGEKFGVHPQSIPDWLGRGAGGRCGRRLPRHPGLGGKIRGGRAGQIRAPRGDPRRSAHLGLAASRAARLAESLAQHRPEALLFRKLATLRQDVPVKETLADLEWQGADARLKEVCHRLGDEKFPGRVPRWRER